jgi:N-acyl-D-aspartate/D-glutamate deacylase
VLAERNDGFMQLSSAPASGEDPFAIFERLAEISGRPVLMNSVQAFDAYPDTHRFQLAWLESCRQRGLPVYGQGITTDSGFTFTFEDWNLFDESDAWREATTGTVQERLAKLRDPARRPALREADVWLILGPIPKIVVLGPRSDQTKPWASHTVGDVAAATGKHPVDAMLDIAVADGLRTSFFSLPSNASLDGFRELMSYEYLLPGVSDGGAHTKFFTAGRFPTETVIRAVKDNDILSLEQVHWRLSTLPAHYAGFRDRGTLEAGKAADIIVYDFERLAMTPVEVAHDFPGGEWRRVQRGIGYRWVFVNGEITIDNDTETGVAAGRLLRHPSSDRVDEL